jgi:hypothetical protein
MNKTQIAALGFMLGIYATGSKISIQTALESAYLNLNYLTIGELDGLKFAIGSRTMVHLGDEITQRQIDIIKDLIREGVER